MNVYVCICNVYVSLSAYAAISSYIQKVHFILDLYY